MLRRIPVKEAFVKRIPVNRILVEQIFARACAALSSALLAAAATVAVAQAQDAYVIGVTGAMTGPPASTYAPPIEGLRLYVERLNSLGGVNGKKVQLNI